VADLSVLLHALPAADLSATIFKCVDFLFIHEIPAMITSLPSATPLLATNIDTYLLRQAIDF
jgi:hypothetical protein